MDEIEDLFEPENNDDSQAPLSSQHDETQIEVLQSDAIAIFEEHADAVYFVDVYVGQDGNPIFVSGDKGEQAIVWQVQKDEEEKDESIIKWTAKEVARLQGHTETVEFSRFQLRQVLGDLWNEQLGQSLGSRPKLWTKMARPGYSLGRHEFLGVASECSTFSSRWQRLHDLDGKRSEWQSSQKFHRA